MKSAVRKKLVHTLASLIFFDSKEDKCTFRSTAVPFQQCAVAVGAFKHLMSSTQKPNAKQHQWYPYENLRREVFAVFSICRIISCVIWFKRSTRERQRQRKGEREKEWEFKASTLLLSPIFSSLSTMSSLLFVRKQRQQWIEHRMRLLLNWYISIEWSGNCINANVNRISDK